MRIVEKLASGAKITRDSKGNVTRLEAAPGPRWNSPSPRRIELNTVKAEVRDLRQRIAALSEQNPRLDGILDNEFQKRAEIAAVDAAEADDVRRYVEHGGNFPSPRTAERKAAIAALESATRAANVARQVEAERQAKLGALAHERNAANKRLQDIITAIIIEELFPATLRRYVAAIEALNCEWQRVLAVIDVLFQNGKAGAISGDARAYERVIVCPMDRNWTTGDAQTVIDPIAMQRAARADLDAFQKSLIADLDSPLPDAA